MSIAASRSVCLTILVAGGLLLISGSIGVQSSDTEAAKSNGEKNVESPSGDSTSLNSAPESVASSQDKPTPLAKSGRGRRRNGRLYNQSVYGAGSTSGAGTSQQTLDSYAAAYAAAGAPSADQSAASGQLVQSPVSDANVYSSFGEPLPSSSGAQPGPVMAGSLTRQLPGEYGSHYYGSYMSPSTNEASHSASQHHQQHHYPAASHHRGQLSHHLPMGYPTNPAYERTGYYDHMSHYQPTASSSALWSSPTFATSGLMSTASSALSHWTNGFSISEIICGLVALAIGAIIVGAPFFLIYLALMGNFSSSGTLSLTNPNQAASPTGGSTTTVNGRRKRLAIFEQSFNMDNDDKKGRTSQYVALADAIASHLSPFVNLQQLSGSFKQLANSIERYSQQEKPKGESGSRADKKSF